MPSNCHQCGYCCRYLDYPLAQELPLEPNAVEFFKARGAQIMHNGLWWCARVYAPCRQLRKNKCGLWPDAPAVCRLTPKRQQAMGYPHCGHQKDEE